MKTPALARSTDTPSVLMVLVLPPVYAVGGNQVRQEV